MKKSKQIVLYLTGSVLLASCHRQPIAQQVAGPNASPSPSPAPYGTTQGGGVGYHSYWLGAPGLRGAGTQSQPAGADAGQSGAVARGGFGSHGGVSAS